MVSIQTIRVGAVRKRSLCGSHATASHQNRAPCGAPVYGGFCCVASARKRPRRGNGGLTWASGLDAVRHGIWVKDGVPEGMSFFMGSVCLLAGAGDIRMLLRGGIAGRKRIARHLWRMCVGLTLATGSAFTNGFARFLPGPYHVPLLFFLPQSIPLILLAYWMARTWLAPPGDWKRAILAAQTASK